jgi:hypothetical protein
MALPNFKISPLEDIIKIKLICQIDQTLFLKP